MNIPFRVKYNRKNGKRGGSTKSTICTSCGNETYEKDGLCILCKKNITQMHAELIDLIAQDKNKTKGKKKNKMRVRGNR